MFKRVICVTSYCSVISLILAIARLIIRKRERFRNIFDIYLSAPTFDGSINNDAERLRRYVKERVKWWNYNIITRKEDRDGRRKSAKYDWRNKLQQYAYIVEIYTAAISNRMYKPSGLIVVVNASWKRLYRYFCYLNDVSYFHF